MPPMVDHAGVRVADCQKREASCARVLAPLGSSMRCPEAIPDAIRSSAAIAAAFGAAPLRSLSAASTRMMRPE